MKILYLDQTGQLGGGEIALLPWLEQHAQDARMVLFEDGPFRSLLEQAGIPVEIVALDCLKSVRRESGYAAIFSAIPSFFALRSRLGGLAGEVDIVYANSQKAFFLAALSKKRGQPLIWHLRDILTADHFSAILRRVAVFLGNHYATAIIANSQATADAFQAAGGRADKVTVVHDGVSSKPFRLENEANFSVELRAKLCAVDKPLVGLFGRLSEWKGQHVLLEAVASLPGAHVVLVGDALFGEDAYVQRLHEMAKKPDLADRVHFLGFRADIPKLMQAVDIIVHCSTAPEPFGLVIVEGMLARRPVIASKAGGALEIIDDGVSGILVPPGDVLALAAAISGLLADPARARAMADTGYSRAESVFSLDRLFTGIGAVLQRVAPHE